MCVGAEGGRFDAVGCHRQQKSLEWELESLLIPEVDAAKEAGRLLADMPRLWAGATLEERHQILTTTLDVVYIDMNGCKSVVSLKAKRAFQAVIGVAALTTPEFSGSTEFVDATPVTAVGS